MQSTAGDIMNRSIINLSGKLDWAETPILLQVHDAIVVETPKVNVAKTAALMKECMEQEVELHGHKIRFPVDCSVGPNWGEMEEL